jgi:hypothetical protein
MSQDNILQRTSKGTPSFLIIVSRNPSKEVHVSPRIIYILRTDRQVFLTNGLQIDGSLHHYMVLDTA